MDFDFHIVVHGILIVALNRKKNDSKVDPISNMEIVVPYDSCHCLIAACMDFDGSVIWQCDLPNRRQTITGATSNIGCPNWPSHDLLLCRLKNFGNYGPNTWCTIGSTATPKVVPLRCFTPGILRPPDPVPNPDPNPNPNRFPAHTYCDNQLNLVDGKGVPSAYALMYGQQSGSVLFDMGTDLKRIMPGKDNVARLHIYAESPIEMGHDALLTLRNCVNDNYFDLEAVSSSTAQASPGVVPSGVEAWEQDTLSEHQQIQISHAPPCYSMDQSLLLNLSPRTCIPMIATNYFPSQE
jgi:hypothetical protein